MARKVACTRCGKAYLYGTKCVCQKEKEREYNQSRDINQTRFYSSVKWKKLRKLVGERDFYICQMCERPAGKSFHCDHIEPRAFGGDDTIENLQVLCKRCHSKKTLMENR